MCITLSVHRMGSSGDAYRDCEVKTPGLTLWPLRTGDRGSPS